MQHGAGRRPRRISSPTQLGLQVLALTRCNATPPPSFRRVTRPGEGIGLSEILHRVTIQVSRRRSWLETTGEARTDSTGSTLLSAVPGHELRKWAAHVGLSIATQAGGSTH